MSDNKRGLLTAIRNSAVIKNPVLFEAIGIAPVVAMAVSIKTAVMLSVISLAELIIIESFACLLLKKVKSCFRVPIYAILGVAINIPFFMFFQHFAPNETANVSIFLPILAVNSLIALHCERVAVRNNFKVTFIDALASGIGYVFVIFFISIIREVLGSGTFYGFELNLPISFSGLTLPFGGFLILGFMAAFIKWSINRKHPEEKPEAAFNLSEISQSHIENIKDLLQEDFNPFDDTAPGEQPERSVRLNKEKLPKEPKAPKQPKAPKTPKAPKEPKQPKVKTVKQKKAKPEKAVEKPVKAPADNTSTAPGTEKPKGKTYVSEFDDLLMELEKAKPSEADKNNENKGGDEE